MTYGAADEFVKCTQGAPQRCGRFPGAQELLHLPARAREELEVLLDGAAQGDPSHRGGGWWWLVVVGGGVGGGGGAGAELLVLLLLLLQLLGGR
ncbi:hypothetical protein Tdes44962_MAKER01713 [Teratosphaeria destructans]|uniref:Uncharacterized protein n=1 Tax=Teratosphaeria destructans TaxID=418781 RepID=A0A9W7W5D3_9PEZI|nr:hypothetical protein Tdes44962_MAKER01713 [Teratosphaeria destructans]